MRRYLGYALAWVGVTVLAVVATWLAVRGAVQYAVVGDAPVPRVESQPLSAMSYEQSPDESSEHPEDPADELDLDDDGEQDSPRDPDRGTLDDSDPVEDSEDSVDPDNSDAPEGTDGSDRLDDGVDDEAYEGRRETIETNHGEVVVEFDDDHASGVRLLSATPDSGYRQHVWETPAWLRVDFTAKQHGSAVFVTWHGEKPQVDVYDY